MVISNSSESNVSSCLAQHPGEDQPDQDHIPVSERASRVEVFKVVTQQAGKKLLHRYTLYDLHSLASQKTKEGGP